MHNLSLTKHSNARMAQRAIHMSDVELIAAFGTECADGYVFLESDCAELERELKFGLQRLSQLKGMRIVTANGTLVTAYHSGPRSQKALNTRNSKNKRHFQ